MTEQDPKTKESNSPDADPSDNPPDGELSPTQTGIAGIAQAAQNSKGWQIACIVIYVIIGGIGSQWLFSQFSSEEPPSEEKVVIETQPLPSVATNTTQPSVPQANAGPNVAAAAQATAPIPAASPQTRVTTSLLDPPEGRTHLERVQHFLDTGNDEDALATLGRISTKEITTYSRRTQIQIAQALENTGEYKAALAVLESAVTTTNRYSPASSAMRVQLARLHLREGRPDAATAILTQLLLEGTNETISRKVRGAVMYLHAQAAFQEWEELSEHSIELLEDEALVYPDPDWRFYNTASVPAYGSRAPSAPLPSSRDLRLISSQKQFPDLAKLGVKVSEMSIGELVNSSIALPGLQTKWALTAERIANSHRILVNVDEIPLNVLLDQLLVPRGLAWVLNGNVVTIEQISVLNKGQRITFLHAVAERAIQNAMTVYPDHQMAPLGMFASGVLAFYGKEPEVAESRFGQLMLRFPRNRYRAAAHYNRGRCLMKTGDWSGALEQFIASGDNSTGGALTAVAWMFAGRMILENGNPRDAIRPLLRAESFAMRIHHKAMVALQLASAWIMADNPRAANEVLSRHAEILRHENYASAAALIGAMSHYRVARTDYIRNAKADELLGALIHAQPEIFFGHHGYLVIGEGWRMLDIPEQMRKAWKLGIAHDIGGEARLAILTQLAEDDWSRGDTLSASEWLKMIAEMDPVISEAGTMTKAQTQLARVAHENGDHKKCLEICGAILKNPKSEGANDVLKLMGTSYQALDDYESAVLCFSGVVPYPIQAAVDSTAAGE